MVDENVSISNMCLNICRHDHSDHRSAKLTLVFLGSLLFLLVIL